MDCGTPPPNSNGTGISFGPFKHSGYDDNAGVIGGGRKEASPLFGPPTAPNPFFPKPPTDNGKNSCTAHPPLPTASANPSLFTFNGFTTQPPANGGRPSSVFDFSNTNLSNFTNFPTTHHNVDSGMARGPTAAAAPCQHAVMVLPVMILPVPMMLNPAAAGFAVAVPWSQLFTGAAATTVSSSHAEYPAAAAAPPFTTYNNAPFVGGQSCRSCCCTCSAAGTNTVSGAFPQSTIFGRPDTATKFEPAAAATRQSTIFGTPFSSTAPPSVLGGPPPFATGTMPPQPTIPFANTNPGKYGFQGKFQQLC